MTREQNRAKKTREEEKSTATTSPDGGSEGKRKFDVHFRCDVGVLGLQLQLLSAEVELHERSSRFCCTLHVAKAAHSEEMRKICCR